MQEFERLPQMDVVGIKMNFFGGDSQSGMVYYQDISEDAAQFDWGVN